MTRILFIRRGSICRSPMAEFVLKDMVKQRGSSVILRMRTHTVSSCSASGEQTHTAGGENPPAVCVYSGVLDAHPLLASPRGSSQKISPPCSAASASISARSPGSMACSRFFERRPLAAYSSLEKQAS